METFESVSVIGLGYIGLPTAAVLAGKGLQVVGVDVDPRAVETINRGATHIIEPDLDGVVHHVVASGKLRAVSEPEPAQVFLVAVPTPLGPDHAPDVSYVEAAARSIAPVLAAGNLVILESTSPAGTTERMARVLAEARPDLRFPQDAGEDADVQVAHCPERVLPGRVLTELVENDRVIGGLTTRCARRARDLYLTFVRGECLLTDARTAEMVKIAENSFRDVNIAFANELANICEVTGVDVWELIELANRHPRVSILNPGPGVGGHCIAVDPWFLRHAAPEHAPLIEAARGVNDGRPSRVAQRVGEACEGLTSPTVACLGLAFKADIDDLRESPAIDAALRVAALGCAETLLAVEPHVDALPAPLTAAGFRKATLEEALASADVLVLLVDHRVFREVPAESLVGRRVVDTRGLWRGTSG